MKEQYKISELIARKVLGVINEDEKDILNTWMQESKRNTSTYSNILERLNNPSKEKYSNKKIKKDDWQKVLNSVNKNKRKLSTIYLIGRVAASILIVVGLSYLAMNTIERFNTEDIQFTENTIEKGAKKAILVLEDGKKVDLTKKNNKEITQSGAIIKVDEQELVYKVHDSVKYRQSEEKYNTIVIPKAGEYSFTLADGTRVWVNSDTKLKYPVKFIGNKRLVYLEGEAYFEVTKDKSKPFIVKTFSGMEVEVLGTKFNVDAYKENEKIKTTLISGKVRVSKDKESSILKPNQQAIYERISNKIVKKEVEAYRYIAWKDGKFLFENERLEDIMIKLSRWYDVEVFFMNQEVMDFHFTGDMERYGDISTILRMIEKSTNIKFRIKNNTIIISSK